MEEILFSCNYTHVRLPGENRWEQEKGKKSVW